MNVRPLLLIVAVVLFVLAAVGVDVEGLNLGWLGSGFFAGSFLTS